MTHPPSKHALKTDQNHSKFELIMLELFHIENHFTQKKKINSSVNDSFFHSTLSEDSAYRTRLQAQPTGPITLLISLTSP